MSDEFDDKDGVGIHPRSAPVDTGARLRLHTGPDAGLMLPLPARFVVGSAPDATLSINDPMISHNHARIECDQAGVWWVEDAWSTNGTTVNNRRLAKGERRRLKDGDLVFAAHIGMEFVQLGVRARKRILTIGGVGALALLLTGLAMLRLLGPKSDDLLWRAEGNVRRGDLTAAMSDIDRAARKNREADLTPAFAECASAIRGWKEAAGSLSAGDRAGALRTLNAMTVTAEEVAPLGAAATSIVARLTGVRTLLHALERAAGKTAGGLEGLRSDCQAALALSDSLALFEPSPPPYLETLATEAGRELERVRGRLVSVLRAELGALDLAPLALWTDDARVERVLLCDSAYQPVPAPNRKEPAGEYDRFLGIEDFYAFLDVTLTERRVLQPLASTPFATVIGQSTSLYARAETLLAALKGASDTEVAAWLDAEGRSRLETVRKAQEQRSRRIEGLVARAAAGQGRDALIAAGAALLLAGPSASRIEREGRPLRDWTLDLYLKKKEEWHQWGEQYGRALPANKAEIARRLRQEALPGTPALDVPPRVSTDDILRRFQAARQAGDTNAVAAVVAEWEAVWQDMPAELITDEQKRQRDQLRSLWAQEVEQARTEAARRQAALAEENRRKAEAQAQAAAEARRAEEARKAEEMRKAEEARLAAEKQAEAERQAAAEKKAAEDRRLAGEKRLAEEKRMQEETKRLAEEKRVKEEELRRRQEAAMTATSAPPVKPAVAKPPVAVPTTGTLEIVVSPPTASIEIDGEALAGNVVELSADRNHKVTISAPGYLPHDQYYRVDPGQRRTLRVLLQRAGSSRRR